MHFFHDEQCSRSAVQCVAPLCVPTSLRQLSSRVNGRAKLPAGPSGGTKNSGLSCTGCHRALGKLGRKIKKKNLEIKQVMSDIKIVICIVHVCQYLCPRLLSVSSLLGVPYISTYICVKPTEFGSNFFVEK